MAKPAVGSQIIQTASMRWALGGMILATVQMTKQITEGIIKSIKMDFDSKYLFN